MNKYFTFLVSILIISFTSPMSTWAYADEVNYCHDKESWKEWDDLIQKYPHDMDIQMLHAVRIGLCKKIGSGSVDSEIAQYAFNHLHEMVIKRAKTPTGKWLKDKQL